MIPIRRRSRRGIILVAPIFGFLILLHLLRSASYSHRKDLFCPQLSGIENVLLVLKTGVTEVLRKLPAHANTTLRCIPNHLVVSDFEEDVAGIHVRDVLRHLDSNVKRNVPDFEIYNRLQLHGREGLLPSDSVMDVNGPLGMPNNPGWKLDKWKFIPMINEAFSYKPDAEWYIFMETDTHIIWPNMLAWLETLDYRDPHYLGTETQIGEVLFAHGGSGIVLSRKAINLAVKHHSLNPSKWDKYVDDHWAGDCVLGKLLADAGVDLTFCWPLMQNAHLGEIEPLTFNFHRQPWCWPILDYHHLSPSNVEQMWQFDHDWFVRRKHKYLLHEDVFKELIQSDLNEPRTDWDNNSLEKEDDVHTRQGCAFRCHQNPECLQWSYGTDKYLGRDECKTSSSARRGQPRMGYYSEWLTDRINATADRLGHCDHPEWE